MLRTIFVASITFCSAAAIAGPRPGTPTIKPSPKQVLSAKTCSTLFGDASLHRKNEAARQKQLYFVDETADGVVIAHSADWTTPQRLRLLGLTLEATIKGRGALITVDAQTARRTGCKSGTYRVAVDHALGQNARVLAVLSDKILVEQGAALRYISGDKQGSPNWLMAWGSRYRVRVAAQSATINLRSPWRHRRLRGIRIIR